jgi:hypothetical protein
MISFSNNNTEIYSLLEEKEKLFKDFETDHVLGFDDGDDFYLIIYQAHNRDFLMWKVTGVRQSNAEMIMLDEEVEAYEGLSVSVQENAMQLIEDRIICGGGNQFYFDAH